MFILNVESYVFSESCKLLNIDLMTASKDKSVQAVDMNTGSVCRAIKKAHEYVDCQKFSEPYS